MRYLKLIKSLCVFAGLVLISSSIAAVDNSTIPLEDIRLFSEAFARIKKNSVYDVDNKELFNHCISGMAQGIDSEASYLDKKKFQKLKTGHSSATAGVGLKLTIKNGYPIVISPIEGAPADRAGLKSGDMILQIDDKDIQGKTLEDVVAKLNGMPASRVQLKVVRGNSSQARIFNLKRENIRIKSLKQKLLSNNIGYIRISAFVQNTAANLKNILTSLEMRSENKLQGLILDLRNNPGGLLREAVVVADTFLDSGLIAYTQARNPGAAMKFMAQPDQSIKETPIVILVNEGTAAASEIVSGALRDHQRATILGKKTFGSGSIQTIMPLGDGTALKLTTAMWLMPGGNIIHGKGIIPDIEVNDSVDDAQLKRALKYLAK